MNTASITGAISSPVGSSRKTFRFSDLSVSRARRVLMRRASSTVEQRSCCRSGLNRIVSFLRSVRPKYSRCLMARYAYFNLGETDMSFPPPQKLLLMCEFLFLFHVNRALELLKLSRRNRNLSLAEELQHLGRKRPTLAQRSSKERRLDTRPYQIARVKRPAGKSGGGQLEKLADAP